jgi:two-component system nitrogen regulation response regulator NtrX
MSADILIVDDEADIRALIKGILDDEGFVTRTSANSTAAFEAVQQRIPSIVILDIWLQGSELDGMEILKRLKAQYPALPVLMISGHGTIETAVSAIKFGAYDFIEKPFKSDRLLLMIQRALEAAALRLENESLKKKVDAGHELIGKSSVFQNILQSLKRVAPTNSRVLLTGEAGTGKDVAARFIHNNSSRAARPYSVLSCATLRPERLEIELFGAEAGVSGEYSYSGVLERAHGGTLLLDEVADMPIETQGKIVRVLQNQNFQRVGGNNSIEVDVRILASTNRDLEYEISQGNFRQDLYYRLNVVPIMMPPLNTRSIDIPLLCEYFCELIASNSGMPTPSFSHEALDVLKAYEWPGNIRQLRNVVEWVMIMHNLSAGSSYGIEHLPIEITKDLADKSDAQMVAQNPMIGSLPDDFSEMSLREAREKFERDYLQVQIERFGGNISKTAQFVGMERSALHRKLKSLEIIQGEKLDDHTLSSDSDSLTLTQRKRA